MEALIFAFDLGLVILAFGGIIAIHELGHFVAARWAGIRVLSFAIGFGPALCSWRKGLGLRRGSSEREYLERVSAAGARVSRGVAEGVWPTEYRLNVLPLGGYVRMLGQDDMDPSSRSDETDSYQSCVPWKRMVVISAGVVANIVSAAVLFVIVFSVGLRDVAPVVGEVAPGRPAATGVALNAADLGIAEPGLKPGDVILAINGETPETFAEVALATAMTARGAPVSLEVRRAGVPEPLRFLIEPREDPSTRMLALGFGPALSGWVYGSETRATPTLRRQIEEQCARLGLPGVGPGMVLWRAGEVVATDAARGLSPYELEAAIRSRGVGGAGAGAPMEIAFRRGDGSEVRATITPEAEFERRVFAATDRLHLPVLHVAGLVPVLMVRLAEEGTAGYAAGLRAGDVFARLGEAEWPSLAEGIAEIRAAEREIRVVVWRAAGPGEQAGALVDLGRVAVKDGRIGFEYGTTAGTGTRVARWPTLRAVDEVASKAVLPIAGADRPSGARLDLPAGTRIVAVDGREVRTLWEVREALRGASAGGGGVDLTVEFDFASGPERRTIRWSLAAEERAALAGLSWRSPLPMGLWEAEHVLNKASGPVDAVGRGLARTKNVMLNVYLTLTRLVQGTVKIEHLQGPVGIAHAGTIFAERGYIWLVFFMALVSVNLAVVNFLPMPIVDGGQFLFLVWEQVTGRPVSVRVQNAATMVGLVLIGSLFLVVTFNDVSNLIARVWN